MSPEDPLYINRKEFDAAVLDLSIKMEAIRAEAKVTKWMVGISLPTLASLLTALLIKGL